MQQAVRQRALSPFPQPAAGRIVVVVRGRGLAALLAISAVLLCAGCQPLPGPVLVREVGLAGDEIVATIREDGRSAAPARYATSRDGLTWSPTTRPPDPTDVAARSRRRCLPDAPDVCFAGRGTSVVVTERGGAPRVVWQLPPGRLRWAATKHDGVVRLDGILVTDDDPFAPAIQDVVVAATPAGPVVVAAAGSEGVVTRTPDGTWHRAPVLGFRPTPLTGRGFDGLTWEAFAWLESLAVLSAAALMLVALTHGTLRFRWPRRVFAGAAVGIAVVSLASQLAWLRWVTGDIARHDDAARAAWRTFAGGGTTVLFVMGAGGWRHGSPKASVRHLAPPLRWRLARVGSRLLLPERHDPWQAERARSAGRTWRPAAAVAWAATIAAVGWAVASRSRLRPGWLALAEACVAAAGIAAALLARHQRRVERPLDDTTATSRPGAASRRVGAGLAATRVACVVTVLVLGVAPGPVRDLVRSVRDGAGCRGLDADVERTLRSAVRGPATLRGIAAVTAGPSTAIVADVLSGGGFVNGVVFLVAPPDALGGDSDLVVFGGYGLAIEGLRPGIVTRDDAFDVAWPGPYRDPIVPALACNRDPFPSHADELEVR